MSNPKKYLILASIGFFSVGIIIFSFYVRNAKTDTRSHAAFDNDLPITADVAHVEEGDVVHFSLYSEDEAIYTTAMTGEVGAEEFIAKQPTYSIQEEHNPTSPVQGTSSGPLLPKNFLDNSTIVRKLDDTKDPYSQDNSIKLDADHYYYTQTVQDIPVFGSVLAIHVKDDKNIYALDGSLLNKTTVSPISISKEQAENIAKTTYIKDHKISDELTPLKTVKEQEYIFNNKLLGRSSDSTNYHTLSLVVALDKEYLNFPTTYFVDLSSGTVVYKEEEAHDTQNRSIANYRLCNSAGQCPISQIPSGDTDIDNTYTFLGDIYSYYKNTFNRDSYDNQGGSITAFVHVNDPEFCPNALWFSTYHQIYICDGLVKKDIIAHEMTHGLTHATANFLYESQSGDIDESLADIFSTALDNNWTIGEDINLPTLQGPLRRMDDPTQKGQPDKLFSPLYYCAPSTQACDITNDYCGVHQNNGVLNKAFYLMAQGGDFNGCHISSIGREKSYAIAYRALTTYLSSTSNFRDFYTQFIRACNDLYDNATCAQVTAAMQATELDQQPANTQTGARCTSQTEARATCSIPSPTNTPRLPTNTPIPTPTPVAPTNTPTPTPTRTPTPTAIPTPTSISTNTPVPNSTILNLSLILHALGSGGDNANQTGGGGNQNPLHKQRSVSISVSDSANNLISKKTSTIQYDSASGTFKGSIDMGTLTTGDYIVSIATPTYLSKKSSSLYHIAQNVMTTIPSFTLVAGDIDMNNQLSILDYQILSNCYSDFTTPNPTLCSADQKTAADINADGNVNYIDLNYFIRELSVQAGD